MPADALNRDSFLAKSGISYERISSFFQLTDTITLCAFSLVSTKCIMPPLFPISSSILVKRATLLMGVATRAYVFSLALKPLSFSRFADRVVCRRPLA